MIYRIPLNLNQRMYSVRFLLLLVTITLVDSRPMLAQSRVDSLQAKLKSDTLSQEQRIDITLDLAQNLISSDIYQAKERAESALQEAMSANYETGISKFQQVKGKILIQEGSYDSAIIVLRKSLEYFLVNDEKSELGNIYSSLGIALKRKGELDSAKYYYKKSFEFTQGKYERGRLLINMGSIFISYAQLDSATHYLIEAVGIFEEINNSEGLTIAFLNLGNIFYKQDDFENALSYYQQSLTHAIRADHKPVQSRNYLNIGAILSMQDHEDSALYYFHKSIPVFQKANDRTGLSAAYRSLGEIYFQSEQYDSAEWYFLECKALAEATGHAENMIRSYKYLTQLYLGTLQSTKALYYADLSVKLAREREITHELEKSLELRRQVLEKTGDFENAYGVAMEQWKLRDSIFNADRLNQISELQTKYETEKKDIEIASLSQQAQIQSLQISQRNNQLIGAGVILLVLILGGVVINQQRKFKHRQAVADMEQQMLRLQMNPHFIFNALASIQNFILQSNTKESVSYLAKFGKLMRQILEHSREEFITVAEEVDMLRNYLEIQQLRFQNRFIFEIEIDKDIDPDHTQIPPLFAQPFVENAIEHGLKDKPSDGLITIRVAREGKHIRLEVEDNGSGINQQANTQHEHKSLATVISRERLGILGKRMHATFTLDVQGSEIGTRAMLLLPAIN